MSIALQRIFAKYSGFLRSVKAVYVLNNILNIDRLQRNKALYKRMGLKKSIVSPIGAADFAGLSTGEQPWLDRPDALEKLEQHPEFQQFSAEIQDKIRQFVRDGYFVLENFVPQNETDALATEVEQMLNNGKVGFNFTGRKIFNFYEHSQLANERFFRRPDLLKILSFLLGKEVIPFQSLNFTVGSEQRNHSDSIHMATAPAGFMIAAWYALEPCTPENGPLVYYPGSHRLPYINTTDYPSGNSALLIGDHSNARYEDKIAQVIAENNLKPATFLANRGDVLVWHANLIHGGSRITGRDSQGHELTRKSMVCHYFAEDVICYHEMLQRPALIKK